MSTVNKPFTFSPNTTASSSQVNDNFDTIYNEFNGSISAANLASNAVTTAKITDSNVTTAKIADDAVTTAKLANEAVTATKIEPDSYTNVRVTRSTTQSISNNTLTVVVYNSETADTLNEYNTSTGVFTAAYAGPRTFTAGFRYQEANNSSTNGLRFYLNGTQLIEDNNPNSLAAFTSRNLSVSINLALGDTVDIRVSQNSGSSRTIDNNANNSYLIISG